MMVCDKWYPKLIEALLVAYEIDIEEDAVIKLILQLKSTTTIHRCLYIPLHYIRAQVLEARHNEPECVKLLLIMLDDLCTLLCGLSSLYDAPQLLKCATIARQFYEEYYSYAAFLKINIPFESINNILTLEENPNPPQYMTIAWYKANGWGEFIKNKTIIPATGPYANIPLRVLKYKGSSTGCEIIADSTPCVLRTKQHAITYL